MEKENCSVVHLPIAYPDGWERPKTEGECPREWRDGSEGGCPLVGCANNTFLYVHEQTGGLRVAYRGVNEPSEVPHSTCAVWWAEQGPLALEDVGRVMGGITRERVRQLEARALSRLGAKWEAFERGVSVKRLRLVESKTTRTTPRGWSLSGAILAHAKANPGILQIDLVRAIPEAKTNKVHTVVSNMIRIGRLVRRDRQIWLAGEEPWR